MYEDTHQVKEYFNFNVIFALFNILYTSHPPARQANSCAAVVKILFLIAIYFRKIDCGKLCVQALKFIDVISI